MTIDIAIPVLNDLELDYTLSSITEHGRIEGITVLISDNRSDVDFRQIIDKYKNLVEIKYSRQESRISFEMNLLAAISLGNNPYVTCAGAGDRIDVQELSKALRLLKVHPQIEVLGGTLSINNRGNIYRNRFTKFSPSGSEMNQIDSTAIDEWIMTGPLSSIGSWIIARSSFERSAFLDQLIIERTKFPQIVMVLGLGDEPNIAQCRYRWFEITEENDPGRLKNAIYGSVEWCSLLLQVVDRCEVQRSLRLRKYFGQILASNQVGFKAFGGKRTLNEVQSIIHEIGVESKYCVLKVVAAALPSFACLCLVRVIRRARSKFGDSG